MKTFFVMAAGAAMLLAVPAFAEGAQWHDNRAPHQACLQIGRIWSWRAPDDRTLIVESNTHKKYRIDLLGVCPGLQFKETIGFRSIGGMSLSCITPGDTVFFHSMGMESRCSIRTVSPYMAEMEKASKAKALDGKK